MTVNTSYIENVVAKMKGADNDIDSSARLHAGKNLYDHAKEPEELIISSIVAREDIPEDLVFYIYSYQANSSYDKTLQQYNQLVAETKIKVENIKDQIQAKYKDRILNDIAL